MVALGPSSSTSERAETSKLGVELTLSGSGLAAPCPVHSDGLAQSVHRGHGALDVACGLADTGEIGAQPDTHHPGGTGGEKTSSECSRRAEPTDTESGHDDVLGAEAGEPSEGAHASQATKEGDA